ncbi:hypothetical protein RhiXN_02794 [Rhizoctonia solani]|uniref:Uncharacterized protein n=1 Tax=Rhizoctonia solani TaxID=456999 RepID=A0A8H8NR85_9AGAM|nr:uncharacterized protein RhiXN_02794 [Rhizoctonia solani]QRW17870.1 hypothetical protein RhiXN_02794 [Rhizoctonia solani]
MLDFTNRRFTIRIGRASKPLKTGEHIARRTSTLGRKTSARRVSWAGGVNRGASVRRSQSALRRGPSVKRTSSTTRRNSKRMSTMAQNQLLAPPSSSLDIPVSTSETDEPEATASLTSPVTSPTSPKSFLSKLTSRFRGRSKVPKVEENHPSLDSVTQGITGGLTAALPSTDLTPVSHIPDPPSLRSPSPTSRVTFVDACEPSKSKSEPQSPSSVGNDDGEWIDAEDDEVDLEPRKSLGLKSGASIDLMHEGVPAYNVPRHSGDLGVPAISPEVIDPLGTDTQISLQVGDQSNPDPLAASLHALLLNDQPRDTSSSDARAKNGTIPSGASTPSKRESRKPRPPQIVVPPLSKTNPFRSLIFGEQGLTTNALPTEETAPPPSPSILLTPALELNGFELGTSRKSSEILTLDYAQVPLPASPSPSSMFAARNSEDTLPITDGDKKSIARVNSMSTLGGRSLSTAPSTRGPTTPTSMRFPGHPALAHFTFGGPSSPSLNVEDCEAGEEEQRGRSLEVQDSKRRMRSVSPKLDAVQEGDESRRSSKASFEAGELNVNPEDKPMGALPLIEENATFGKRSDGDSESEHEDECGFYAFAERQLEEDKRATDAKPKRSKTMSFLNVGFGKRKSAIGEPQSPPSTSVSRSATSSRLLALPAAGPKRSSTLMAPPPGGNRISRLVPTQRSSTLLAEPLSPREAVSPIMYTAGDIQSEAGKIEDEESRRLCEAAFMF